MLCSQPLESYKDIMQTNSAHTFQQLPAQPSRSVRYASMLPAYFLWLLVLLCSPLANSAENPAIELDLVKAQQNFLANPDFRENLTRLMELEKQALALIEDEPLKMGSLGSAILDTYPASQTGHLAMSNYYEHLEVTEAKATHDTQLAHIQSFMQQQADGRVSSPFAVMTIYDAHAFARSHDLSPVGSIYQSGEHARFGFLLIARPDDAKLRQIFFDITHLLPGLASPKEKRENKAINPWGVIRILAAAADGAAQTAIGAHLANVKKYEDALSWLKVASRTDNVLANTLLARIYWTQSGTADDAESKTELQQRAEENYLHAVALGSTDAMYSLANLYLSGDILGADTDSAIPLLEQAGQLGHAESLVHLAHLYNTGAHIGAEAKDQGRAHSYFQQAAALNHPGAILSYGRFLVAERYHVEPEEPIFAILAKLAKSEPESESSTLQAEAMILIANLNARDIAPQGSKRTAIKWYKKAVRLDPESPDTVNEVAWTLTVSDVTGLQRNKYAKRIMDKLMVKVPAASDRPEYLDTWAATHAAVGDFESAIRIQNLAIDAARQMQQDDVLEILSKHLQQFEKGEAIKEPAP